jgi:hypothetical protein
MYVSTPFYFLTVSDSVQYKYFPRYFLQVSY